MNGNFLKILETDTKDFRRLEFDYPMLAKYKSLIEDKDYFEFIIESKNGGFFFDQSLHLYGFNESPNFHSIESINGLLQEEYRSIASDLLFFGQDIFGNQFSFDLKNRKIVFFNIETGERQTVALNFIEWVHIVLDQLDYFTGKTIARIWQKNGRLQLGERLCPKIPFITGGEYSIENLYASKFPNYLATNANIARQVFNLPDGTEIKIVIKNGP